MTRSYLLRVSDSRPFRPYLEVRVSNDLSSGDQGVFAICTIPLTQLATHEVSLDDGRFLHFQTQTQEHLVGYWMESSLEEDFSSRLWWIHQNVHSGWFFEVTMEHVGRVRMLWSFEDLGEALLFKLSL